MVSIAFLRRFFGIPRKYKMKWAVIVEENKDGQIACRLGVLLLGTSKTVDVIRRKFVESELQLPVKRMTYPAKKKSDGNFVQFDTLDEKACKSIRISKSKLNEAYFTAHYSPELMHTFVF